MRKTNNPTGIFTTMLLSICIVMMQTAFSQTDCDPPCEHPTDSSEPDASGNRSNPCSNIISLGAGGPANLQYFVQNGTGVWPTSFCYTQVCNGKEQIYSFTAPYSGIYKIHVTYTNFQYVAYHWKSEPCSSAGWNCIELPYNPGTYGNMNWTAGTTYYILLDARTDITTNHQFYLGVPEAPGTWYGTVSPNWHNSSNWSGGYVPNETVDVVIPSGTTYQPNVQNNNAKCKSLTVQANATLNIGAYELHAHGAVNIHGALNMTSTLSKLRTESDINWHPGSSASLTASSTIFVRGNWEFMNGANIQLNTGFVDFFGSGNSYMRTLDAGSHFYHVRNNKAGTLLGHSGASTQPCRINGNLFIYNNCKLSSNSIHNIQLGGYVNNMSGMIQLANGTFVFGGAGSSSTFMTGDYFNHVTINSSSETTFNSNIEIRGNLVIQSGKLSVGDKTITLKGDWKNDAFPTGFDAGTGRVIFNRAAGHQHIYSSENFNIMEVDMNAAVRITNAAHTVTCNQYDWTSGGIDVLSGTFTALDLAQNGLYGGFWVNPGGTINITNSTGSTWVDLRGSVNILGGTMNLTGTYADWPYANGANFTMTGGVLDIKTCNFRIYSGNTWTYNISGGTIRLGRGYESQRADFTPAGGTVEFYGTTDWSINQANGSTLHHVKINKGAREGDEDQISGPVYDERSGELLSDGSRANTISLGSNFSITGNLNIDAGTFSIGQYTCDIGGNTNITGTLAMTHASGVINAYGNVTWKTGSTANFTAMSVFNVWGHWNFQSGSNANLANGVVAFAGSSNKYVTNHSLESSFNNISSYKTTGFKVGIEHSSSSPLTINGNIYVHPNAGFGIYSLFNVILKGDVNSDGDFHCNFGTVVLNGVDQNLRMNTGNYFRNLKFNQSGTVTIDNSLSNILDVKGNVVIQSGVYDMQDRIMHVGGNWTNNAGTAAFNEGTGRVVFNGTGTQTCNSETFNILEVNKTSGTMNFPGTTLCATYDWTAGGIIVSGGTFTANDLADPGLFGSYTVNNGTINLHQDALQYIDFAGDITIGSNGVLNIYGGSSACYWPYHSNASLTMSGNAILDIKDQGIYVNHDYSLSFTHNITGGTIRTTKGYAGNRNDFSPAGGTFEFYGTGEWYISQASGSTLHNVKINKSAKNGREDTGSSPVYDKRSGMLLSDGGKTNTINLGSNFSLTGSLHITSGSLDVGPYQLTVADDINIHDHLIMTNSAAIINAGDEVNWYSGSTGNVSAGAFNLGHRMVFFDGSDIQLSTGNTINLTGTGETAIRNYSPLAKIGNLNINSSPGTATSYVSVTTSHPVHVQGDMTVSDGNHFRIQSYQLIVDGTLHIHSQALMDLGSFAGGGHLNCNGTLILDGTLDVDRNAKSSSKAEHKNAAESEDDGMIVRAWQAGEVNVYGEFTLNDTGVLNIPGGGNFLWDPATEGFSALSGTINLADGVFEATNRSIIFTGNSNISGGVIRLGRSLISTLAGAFQPSGGTVEFVSSFGGHYIQLTEGNHLHNLIINKSNTSLFLHDQLIVKNNVLIQGGVFDGNWKEIYVGGDWFNTVGHNAFSEIYTSVIFNGAGNEQHAHDEVFYILKVDKPSGGLLHTHDISCISYEWIAGGISAPASKSFIVDYSIANDGLYGTFRAHNDALIELRKASTSSVSLIGNIEIFGSGTIRIYGGHLNSYWGKTGNASLTMDGGLLDFVNSSIVIEDEAPFAFTSNITGGIIRTGRSFNALSPGFDPVNNTVELYGNTNAELWSANGGAFYDVFINKPNLGVPVILNSAVVKNNLTITGSSLMDFSKSAILECRGNISNSGQIIMDDGAEIRLKNNSFFNVNDAGRCFIWSQNKSDPAKITGISPTDYYTFTVQPGGVFVGMKAVFENMNEQGINFMPGSQIWELWDCEFRNGKAGSNPMLTIDNNQDLVLENITFNGSSKASQFNVRKNVNEGSVFFLDANGDMAGETFEDDTHGRIHWMLANYASDPQTVGNNDTFCADAFYNLTVEGLVVENGGTVDLIAGNSIVILPGTIVYNGGKLHARITENNEFCAWQPAPVVAVENQLTDIEETLRDHNLLNPTELEARLFRIYPNPTSGRFTLEVNAHRTTAYAQLQIFNMQGSIIYERQLSGSSHSEMDLSDSQDGIYLVRLTTQDKTETVKVVKQ